MMRKIAAGTALAGALILSLVGCDSSGDSGGDDKSPKPAEALAAAVAKTGGTSMKLALAGDKAEENLQDSYDTANKIGSFEGVAGGDKMTIIVTTDEIYLGGLKDLAGKTMRMQIAKLAAGNAMALFADPLAPLSMLPAATEVTSSGDGGSYAGTIDLTKVQATVPGTTKFVEYVKTAAGQKANAIKFTATVDDKGYLSKFKATFPGVDEGKDSQYDLTLSDFGSAVSVTKPAGENLIDAPDTAYQA